MILSFVLLSCFVSYSFAQRAGTFTAESPPSLTWARCTTASGCATTSGRVILDANYRWVHIYNSYSNCYQGSYWNSTYCPDGKTCADNCALEGADYYGANGIITSGNALTFKTVAPGGTYAGARLMLAGSTGYELFKPLNQEIAFDVDVSQLSCGYNSALSFVHMDADGGLSKYATNKAGWKYGTGYCDSKCARDQKFINGEGNVKNWTAQGGYYGSCCNELSVWEANSMATVYSAHPCNSTITSQMRCEGNFCISSNTCDTAGCDYNPYRLGNPSYYGIGKVVDTSRKITIVTQFISSTAGTTSGTLSEIRRLYVQNGIIIANARVNLSGFSGVYSSITNDFCDAEKTFFSERNYFKEKGGLSGSLSKSAASGMVLTISLTQMLTSGIAQPFDLANTGTGFSRGPCSYGGVNGSPVDIPNSAIQQFTVSNIRFGDLNSTFNGTAIHYTPAK